MGDGEKASLKLKLDPKVRLEFHGTTSTSDAGLLAARESDEALGLTEMARDLNPAQDHPNEKKRLPRRTRGRGQWVRGHGSH